MDTPNTFEQKLKAGLQAERLVLTYLESLGHTVFLNDSLDRSYLQTTNPSLLAQLRQGDMLVNGVPVEIKLDILSAKTGNVVIEHQSLRTHTAPYYIYVLPTFYKTTKQKLEYLVDTFPDKKPIGDDGRIGTVVPINSSFFRETFTKL